jgi:hypothetical protein
MLTTAGGPPAGRLAMAELFEESQNPTTFPVTPTSRPSSR